MVNVSCRSITVETLDGPEMVSSVASWLMFADPQMSVLLDSEPQS